MKISHTVFTLLCLTTSAVMAQTPADSVGVQLSTNQSFIATGTVIDESGEPVIGATVAQAGKRKNMTVTDLDGHFSISGINIPCKLRITSVGSLP